MSESNENKRSSVDDIDDVDDIQNDVDDSNPFGNMFANFSQILSNLNNLKTPPKVEDASLNDILLYSKSVFDKNFFTIHKELQSCFRNFSVEELNNDSNKSLLYDLYSSVQEYDKLLEKEENKELIQKNKDRYVLESLLHLVVSHVFQKEITDEDKLITNKVNNQDQKIEMPDLSKLGNPFANLFNMS